MINPNETKSVFWLVAGLAVVAVVAYFVKKHRCAKAQSVPSQEEIANAASEAVEDLNQE